MSLLITGGLVLSNITTQRLAINYNGFCSNGMQLQAAFIIAQYHTERNLHLDNWNFLCYTIFHQNIKRIISKFIVIRVACWLRYWFHYALGWRSLFGYERYQKCDSKPQIDEIAHATLLFYWLRCPACSETIELNKVAVSSLCFWTTCSLGLYFFFKLWLNTLSVVLVAPDYM